MGIIINRCPFYKFTKWVGQFINYPRIDNKAPTHALWRSYFSLTWEKNLYFLNSHIRMITKRLWRRGGEEEGVMPDLPHALRCLQTHSSFVTRPRKNRWSGNTAISFNFFLPHL